MTVYDDPPEFRLDTAADRPPNEVSVAAISLAEWLAVLERLDRAERAIEEARLAIRGRIRP